MRLAGVLLVLLILPAFPWFVLGSAPIRARVRAIAASAIASRLPGARLESDVRFDGLFRIVLGPITLASHTPGAPLLLSVARATVRPSLTALLGGRLEAASIGLEGVSIGAGRRGEGMEELMALCQSRSPSKGKAASSSRPPRVTFDEVTVLLGSRSLGPFSGALDLVRAGELTTVDFSLRLPGGGRGSLRARLAPGQRALEAHLRRLSPGPFLKAARAHLPIEVERGTLDLTLVVPRLERFASGEAHFTASTVGLVLSGARLAAEPVGPLALRARGTVRWSLAERSFALEATKLDLGAGLNAEVLLRLEVAAQPEPRLRLELRAEGLDWEEAMSALPPALAPPAEAPPLRGVLSGWIAVSGPLRQWERWHLEAGLDPAHLVPAPPRPRTVDLTHAFTFQARQPDGTRQGVLIGPENPSFVPLSAVPPHVVRAVLASEDAGFYGHHGFDFGEMQEALSQATIRGRLRGASTISQQVAKNLFLSPERTFARKVREGLATIALEVALGKKRMLEVYLNLVEWGPGVYGVGAAAHHWFGKDVRELDPKEAAFLASVIPNPIRFEMYRRRGALTEAWETRVRGLLLKLRAIDAISEEQLHRVWDERLNFAHGA
ncbi:MAG TPA: transglycosylase domain-containing protein [Anaeromyxobacteraceae bacterium]|nr:transglycosylase domain-containing protein [Anaeromyxobacteraceae bacterium]